MNERGTFYRKIAYLICMAVLLFPISRLGAPSTLQDDGATKDEGGTLAQLRSEYNLGQADIGQIDPASETIRFATLGLRGIAVSLLWNKANEYKKTEDWTNFRATLQQLAKLQPYFISFWKYQAWNLTYNVSVELDDVRDRFHYVKKGIEFLKEGTTFNRDNPSLLAELGWFSGNKIGRADEHVQYRRLYKLDDDFHPADRPPEQRDNWLVSKQWYLEAVSTVDDKKRSLGTKNPTTFYSAPAMAQINYSEAIESEGTFGHKARSAWSRAAEMWDSYGKRRLRSSRGFDIRLIELEKWEKDLEELGQRLHLLGPGLEHVLQNENRDKLSAEQLAAMETDPAERTDEQHILVSDAESTLVVSLTDLADRIARETPEKAAEARQLAHQISDGNSRLSMIRNNRQVVNYEYWQTRCALEQEPAALKAHQRAFDAEMAFKEHANLFEAKRLYEESFRLWAEVLAAYPNLPDDSATGSDLMELVDKYVLLLEQLDLSLTDKEVADAFPLWNIVEANDMERDYDSAIEKHREQLHPLLQEAGAEEESTEEGATDQESGQERSEADGKPADNGPPAEDPPAASATDPETA
jgi:hypothetical protein